MPGEDCDGRRYRTPRVAQRWCNEPMHDGEITDAVATDGELRTPTVVGSDVGDFDATDVWEVDVLHDRSGFEPHVHIVAVPLRCGTIRCCGRVAGRGTRGSVSCWAERVAQR